MPLEIISREQEGVQVVDLKGDLTFGQADLDFRTALENMVRSGKIRVVLDLNGIGALDATGLATLEFAAAELKNLGGGLALADLKPAHIELLIDFSLSDSLPLYNDDEDAINSFFPGREVKHYDILEFVRSRKNKPD